MADLSIVKSDPVPLSIVKSEPTNPIIPGNTPAERRQYLLAHPEVAAQNRAAIEREFGSFEHAAPEDSGVWRFVSGLASPITGPARELWQFVSDHDAWVREHAGRGGAMGDLASIPGAAQAQQAAAGDVAGAFGSGLGQAGLTALQLRALGPKRLDATPETPLEQRLASLNPRAPEPVVVVAPKPVAVPARLPEVPAVARTVINKAGFLAPGSRTLLKIYDAGSALFNAVQPELPPEPIPESPGSIFAKAQGIDWASLRPEDQAILEHSAQAQANAAAAASAPRPAYTPPPAPEAAPVVPEGPLARPKTLADMVLEDIAARRATGELPPEQTPPPAAPAAAPPAAQETPPQEPAVSAPATAPVTPRQAARAITEPLTRIDKLTSYFTRGRGKGITDQMLGNLSEGAWATLATDAGVEAPTAEQIAQVRANVAAFKAAKSVRATGSPAEAQAEFAKNQATLAGEAPTTAPEEPRALQPQAGETAYQEQQARIEPPPEEPPAAPAGPAVSEPPTAANVAELPEVEDPGRYLKTEEGTQKSAALRGQEIKLRNMRAKAGRWAMALAKHGIGADDLAAIPAGTVAAEDIAKGAVPGWGNILDDLVNKGLLKKGEKPPGESLPLVVDYMRNLEGQKPAAATGAEVIPMWTSDQGPRVTGKPYGSLSDMMRGTPPDEPPAPAGAAAEAPKAAAASIESAPLFDTVDITREGYGRGREMQTRTGLNPTRIAKEAISKEFDNWWADNKQNSQLPKADARRRWIAGFKGQYGK